MLHQGFPSGLLKEGHKDSLFGVKGSFDYDSGVTGNCFKEIKTTAKVLINSS